MSDETLTMIHNALRVAVGTEDLELPFGFGTIELQLFETCGICSSLGFYDFAIQGWVLPIYKASGRYSVGLSASRMDDFCADGGG